MGYKRRSRTNDKTRAIAIVRTSTDKQDIGVEAQKAEIAAWAAQNNVDVVAVFEDLGVSGGAPMVERPGLLYAISRLREDNAGLLLAARRDRFARNKHTISDIERAAASAGAKLISADGLSTVEDSEGEELQTGLADLLAAYELRKITQRNKARAAACRAAGRTHGGDIPYGMKRADSGHVGRSGKVMALVPDDKEQEVIGSMRGMRQRGMSYAAIAEMLMERGVPSRRGTSSWQAMTVKRILDR